jgi:hypothetical protein
MLDEEKIICSRSLFKHLFAFVRIAAGKKKK